MKKEIRMNSRWVLKGNFRRRMANGTSGITLFLVVLLIACSKKDSYVIPVAQGVAIKSNSTFGNILTDDLGQALYFFSSDYAGANTCYGGCATDWPVFYVSNISLGSGLDQTDFSEITNANGAKQTTYKGWPLYYYLEDKKEGDVLGDKVGNFWYVAKPDYSVMVSYNPATGKKYLVAPKGKTLYIYDNDANGVSNCTGSCITTWPAFANTNMIVPSLLSASDFGLITRTSDATHQSTYKGRPLYYYSLDQVRGDVRGHGLSNGAWLELDDTRF